MNSEQHHSHGRVGQQTERPVQGLFRRGVVQGTMVGIVGNLRTQVLINRIRD